jgi:hypothetical protein
MLIGPVVGRCDSILEWMAKQIEQGVMEYDPDTSIIRNPDTGSRFQINEDGSLREIKNE